MNEPNEAMIPPLSVPSQRKPALGAKVPPKLLLAVAALLAGFSVWLFGLTRFALNSSLYSYIILIPFVSGYLFSQTKRDLSLAGRSNRVTGFILLALGVVALASYGMAELSGAEFLEQDQLALTTLSFVLLLAGVCAVFLDGGTFKRAVFPLMFLLFMVPFPLAMEHAIESFLQHGSAPPAYWFFSLVGTPVFKQDLVFQLPGMTLQIAPECSGIRSTLVLFMTSLVAGHLFLNSTWKRAVLTLVVIPLALVRNGFRVFVIGELCVRIGPHMIDSPIHHQGGPIFFALSLIPFSLLVYFLIKSDRRASQARSQPLVP